MRLNYYPFSHVSLFHSSPPSICPPFLLTFTWKRNPLVSCTEIRSVFMHIFNCPTDPQCSLILIIQEHIGFWKYFEYISMIDLKILFWGAINRNYLYNFWDPIQPNSFIVLTLYLQGHSHIFVLNFLFCFVHKGKVSSHNGLYLNSLFPSFGLIEKNAAKVIAIDLP